MSVNTHCMVRYKDIALLKFRSCRCRVWNHYSHYDDQSWLESVTIPKRQEAEKIKTEPCSVSALEWSLCLGRKWNSGLQYRKYRSTDTSPVRRGKSGRKLHEWSEEIPAIFYVLKKSFGSPPHWTTIRAIVRFLISIANRLFAVLYPMLLAFLYTRMSIATIIVMYIITCIPFLFKETKWLTLSSCLINLKKTSMSHRLR